MLRATPGTWVPEQGIWSGQDGPGNRAGEGSTARARGPGHHQVRLSPGIGKHLWEGLLCQPSVPEGRLWDEGEIPTSTAGQPLRSGVLDKAVALAPEPPNVAA